MAGETENGVSARLEDVRREGGYATLRDFHTALTKGGDYRISYEAVRNYHYDRTPPLEYVVAVSRRFGVPLEWLATGEGGTLEDARFRPEPAAGSPLPAFIAEGETDPLHPYITTSQFLIMQVHHGIYKRVDRTMHLGLDEDMTAEAAIATLSFEVFRVIREKELLAAGAPRMNAPEHEREAWLAAPPITFADLAEKMAAAGEAIGEAIAAPFEALPPARRVPSHESSRYVTTLLMALVHVYQGARSDLRFGGIPPVSPRFAFEGQWGFMPLRAIVERLYEDVYHPDAVGAARRSPQVGPDTLMYPPGEYDPEPKLNLEHEFPELDRHAEQWRVRARGEMIQERIEQHAQELREWEERNG